MKKLNDKNANELFDKLIKEFQFNYAFKYSKNISEYRKNVGNTVLSKQARLFYINNNHPEPKGSVSFIKYKGACFVVTNEHCVRETDKENYTVLVPSKKTDIKNDNETVQLKLQFLHADKFNDLAAFRVESDALKDTKRSFTDLFPGSFTRIDEHSQVILVGVPEDRLEYLYPGNDYFKNVHTIMYNHITYFTQYGGVENDIHAVFIDPEQTQFGEGTEETRAFFHSLQGMSGGPAFVHSYETLNAWNVRFLGITSNGDPKAGKAYIIDISVIKSFLNDIIGRFLN
ncbi:trypsin-like peptidase [Paenibacillus sp. BK033]|uniref:trypsin-like peptidase domain-containing protein n=1 Tax=Paenibacillus sp. BK033 TaxID=2512133 RepID=UPI0010DAF66E|nr:trypsin-like peptidase domain-containing protein [Paenibacillus sp. BK033]TCM99388.1 trypsin-like peptidase [Paenibacillus sp. BK033]